MKAQVGRLLESQDLRLALARRTDSKRKKFDRKGSSQEISRIIFMSLYRTKLQNDFIYANSSRLWPLNFIVTIPAFSAYALFRNNRNIIADPF